jgi:putative endonuclease
MPDYFFYIIFSHYLNKYYLGHSSEIHERIRKHNSNHKGFTGNVNDWKLVYSEKFDTKEAAYARERELKKWKNRRRSERLGIRPIPLTFQLIII